MNQSSKFSLIFLIPAVLLSFMLSGQSGMEEARKQLNDLHEGVLLVRLKTNNASIEAMQKAGFDEKAELARQEQYEKNKETILSFSQAFDFAPVYFFYSDDSEAIRQGNLAGNVFGSDLKPVPAEELKGKPIFTGEFTETPNTGIEAFVVMGQDLIPLKSPFPFYQRKHVFFSLITLSQAKVVERYNEKLTSTYKLWFDQEL